MGKISEDQYEFALGRIEELLPLVDGYDPKRKEAVKLSVLSDIVIEYEKEYYPIEKLTVLPVPGHPSCIDAGDVK